jgi:hypothetical protein
MEFSQPPPLTRNPKLKWPVCLNVFGINRLEKSHQTTAGMASIFPKRFCSNSLTHPGHFNFGFRVETRRMSETGPV